MNGGVGTGQITLQKITTLMTNILKKVGLGTVVIIKLMITGIM